MQTKETTELTGEKFNLESYLYAREKAWQGLNQLAQSMRPGDTELSVKERHLDYFPNQEKSWHPPKIRLSGDTICSFKEKSPYQRPIALGELFFFDFGPIIRGHEADVGDTFCLGDEGFINPAKEVFQLTEDLWKKTGLTGAGLYQKASEFAQAKGLELSNRMNGHRLSDFPHAIHHKGSLANFESEPSELLWVLEIHLIDAVNKKGYFYEDILGSP